MLLIHTRIFGILDPPNTHPNMDSFLSSVDLHALYDFAKDNHSIVSLVLAPQQKTCPAFVLTEKGLTNLAACKQQDFHRHDDIQATTWYKRAPLVLSDHGSNIILVDFRLQK